MSLRVWKYALPLSVGMQNDMLVVWALVDWDLQPPDTVVGPRRFIVANTGMGTAGVPPWRSLSRHGDLVKRSRLARLGRRRGDDGVTLAAVLTLAATSLTGTSSEGGYALASAYSAHSTGSTVQGCPGAPPLRDYALSFASLAVPCGARVRFCVRGRCATGRRTDSGPYVRGRSFDLNRGLVHALGFRDEWRFGVRRVYWRRVR